MYNQKILVDTSIWIEYFKNNKKFVSVIEKNLNLENILITGPVISELLHGIKSSKEYEMLSSSISAVPYIECLYEDWMETGKVLYRLKEKGVSIPLTDALIASVAIREDALVLTQDKHFKYISDITSLKLY